MLPVLSDEINAAGIYSQLRLVGIRIDPCFPDANPAFPSRCHSQIRMIWQPVAEMPGFQQLQAKDAAIHTFYELSETEFREFALDLLTLKRTYSVITSGLPLGQHPALNFQGGKPAFAQAFLRLILSHTGSARLTKFTFMTGLKAGTQWDFGGYDVHNATVSRIQIPRVHAPLQTFLISTQDRTQFIGGIQPSPPGIFDAINDLISNSAAFFKNANEGTLEQTIVSINRIENPRIYSPVTMDCASCHVAQAARGFIYNSAPRVVLEEKAGQFVSMFNLHNSTAIPGKVDRVRAFGYFNQMPSISQRAINESAAVAEEMNLHYVH